MAERFTTNLFSKFESNGLKISLTTEKGTILDLILFSEDWTQSTQFPYHHQKRGWESGGGAYKTEIIKAILMQIYLLMKTSIDFIHVFLWPPSFVLLFCDETVQGLI